MLCYVISEYMIMNEQLCGHFILTLNAVLVVLTIYSVGTCCHCCWCLLIIAHIFYIILLW